MVGFARTLVCIIIVILQSAHTGCADVSPVKELTTTNFDAFVSGHKFCLVSFVAPW